MLALTAVIVAGSESLTPCTVQAVLEAERDGIINEIAEPYFDISQCAGVQAHEAVSASEQNITLMDVGGVFLILGIFVGISLVLWIFRRSPPAKKQRKKYHERQDKRQESSKQVSDKRTATDRVDRTDSFDEDTKWQNSYDAS